MQADRSGHVEKRVKPETYELLNNALLKWFKTMRKCCPLNHFFLPEKQQQRICPLRCLLP